MTDEASTGSIERCSDCGGSQVVWHADDALYVAVMGRKDGDTPCPRCFDRRAQIKGVDLRWTTTRTPVRAVGDFAGTAARAPLEASTGSEQGVWVMNTDGDIYRMGVGAETYVVYADADLVNAQAARIRALEAALKALVKVCEPDGWPRHGSNVELWFSKGDDFYIPYDAARAALRSEGGD